MGECTDIFYLMPDVSVIAHKVLATKKCGPGKVNKHFPNDSLSSMENASHSSHSDLHFTASVLFFFFSVFMIMFISGLLTEITWW